MKKNEFRIESPCSRERESLDGAGSVRWCPDCRKYVYDLSKLTWRQIEGLSGNCGQELCAIVEREPDGQLRTAEGPSWPRMLRRRFLRWAALFAAASWKFGFAQELRPGRGGVRGVVVDSTGAVIANTRVSTSTGESAHTDSLGRYSFLDLPPGLLTLHAEAPGFLRRTIEVVVRAGSFTEVANLALAVGSVAMGELEIVPIDASPAGSPPLPRVAGLVTDQSGAAFAGAEVALTGGSGVRWRAVSAADGRFSVSPLRWGDYQLEVTAPGYSSHRSGISTRTPITDAGSIVLERK